MKLKTHYAAIALSFGLVGASQGAISFLLDQTGGFTETTRIESGVNKWNFQQAGSFANIYWDANNNGVFGEAGENSGNTDSSLANGIDGLTINSGDSLVFAVEGFGTPDTATFVFDITNSDSTTQTVSVVSGLSTIFTDANGDQYRVVFDFTPQGYGDVVKNIDSVPGGKALDHKAVLTFTAVPEPSSAALLGLGGLALLLRRRK